MIDLTCLLVSLCLLALAFVVQPQHATCPHGFDLLTGVRDDGSFACTEHTAERWQTSSRGGWRDVSAESRVELRARVYCTGGNRPVISSGEVVSCMHGGWE